MACHQRKGFAELVGRGLLALALLIVSAGAVAAQEQIVAVPMDSSPVAPAGVAEQIVTGPLPQGAFMLSNVPTSSWTYGCSATSAGMMFGYYDRTGFSNMYTGPCNGGLAPLTNLGSACSIIATGQGFDGRAARGHVDDYWVSYGSAGPDPWEGHWAEHAWGGCTSDYMGTNQWKWDFNGDGTKEYNIDGGTALFWYNGPWRLYNYVPSASAGLPQTELCHGLRLFAESRGYTVLTNYTQRIAERYTGGFTFDDYMNEINNGFPVMIQVTGHSMVGVGYDAASRTVYLHDTWGDYVAQMTWGGSYSGMEQQAVTVIHPTPEPATLSLLAFGGLALLRRRKRRVVVSVASFVFILGAIAHCALAETWSTVYQTDFLTDPGWTTNNSAHFYWDSGTQTFFQSQQNGSEEYAYKLLPSPLQGGQKWRIEYDIKVASDAWAANAGVALTDSHISHQVASQMTLDFAHIDAGYRPFLEWSDDHEFSQSEFSDSFSLNTWYHAFLQWDPTTGTLYGRVTDRDNGTLLSEKSVSGLGTFSDIDRVAMTTVDHTYASGAVATAYIDNITVSQTPEPATLSLLALGAVTALARRRRKA